MTVPPSRKIGLSGASRSRRRVRPRTLVGVHGHRLALRLGHVERDDLVVEAAGLGGGHRAPVRLEREGVLVLARDPVALGHVLARLAHRLGRVAAPPCAGSTKRQPSVVSTSSTLPRGKPRSGLSVTNGARDIDSTPPASTRSASPRRSWRLPCTAASRPEAQRRLTVTPGHLDRQAGEQAGHARDVAVVLARLVGAAHVDLVDARRGRARCARRRRAPRARRGRRAGTLDSTPP